jgi:hypothetical protein
MTLFRKLDQHSDLMKRMADTVEADFASALVDGRLSGEGLRAALMRCSRCEQADFCESWLDVNEARKAEGGEAPRAPDFCANLDLMERLGA